MFIYTIYGLIIESDIFIRELIQINNFEKVDVTISYGNATKEMKHKVCDAVNVKFSKSEFYLYVEGVAHYYVAHGNKIIVELENKCDEMTSNIFLLGTCFGMLLSQRKTIAIHGGAVLIGGTGVIITGETGTGKSTLTAAFRKEGYSFLADDVSALGEDREGNTIIYPAFPRQKLCKDAIEKMGDDLSGYMLIDKGRDKYSIPTNGSFWGKSVPLKSIFEINVVENEQVSIKQLFGGDKLRVILRNIYRIETINYAALDSDYFKKCIVLSNKISVFRINRPKDKFSVKDQMKLIIASLS